jgi:polar amino acid transport system substrate-binding protein
MKKFLALALAVMLLAFSLSACSTVDDVALVKERGKLIVGITDFAPMDYQDANGNWIGFDAELAELFAEYLDVDVEFFVIADWSKKALELEDQSIDCVWNGMTLTDEVMAAMATSNAYCNNAQVVVLPASVASQYTTVESLQGLTFAVENGSAGEAIVDQLGFAKNVVAKQSNALMEVSAGTSDACVIDLLMAASMTGEGTDYPNLTSSVKLNDGEQYGVGFRKDSNLVDEINEFFKQVYADGTMQALAAKYKIANSVIPQE